MVKGLQAKQGTCSRTVSFDHVPLTLIHWKDLVAVALEFGDIIIHDAVTGVQMSVLSGHTRHVNSLAFSSDGTFLVSGSNDKTVNLWDIQTGGIIKTFHGHTDQVYSVSISQNCTMIASGSHDYKIRLWDVQTGECCCIIDGHNGEVSCVSFSPTNPQLLMSASYDSTVRQWDIDGYQITSAYGGNHVAFSSDGTCFVSWRWRGRVATVQDSDSRGVITRLRLPGYGFQCCCFSPNGKFVVGGAGHTIYIWDITSSNPHPVETLTGHTEDISSLTFSSSLISSSWDKSIKFWQTNPSSTYLVATDSEYTLVSAQIMSVSLQAADGIAISSDSVGVVKTWDISTGLCKASYQTPVRDNTWRDTQLIKGRMTCVWLDEDKQIHTWDTERGEHLQTLGLQSTPDVMDLRMSGDGSTVFLLYKEFLQTWSILTGEIMSEVRLEGEPLMNSLITHGSRVWFLVKDLQTQGWEFGLSGSNPVSLSNVPLDRPHLCFIGRMNQYTSQSGIMDIVSRKEVFQLYGGYGMPLVAQWDGRYLIAGYGSGEVLILDLNCMIPQ